MNDHRPTEGLSPIQRELKRLRIMAGNGSDVLQPQVFEHALRRDHVLDALFEAMQCVVGGGPNHWSLAHDSLDATEEPFIPVGRAQSCQVLRDATDRRCIRSCVVVDHNDHLTVAAGNVVERLPRHSARQCAVADYRNNVTSRSGDCCQFTPQCPCLRDAIGVGKRRGRVRVFNDIVWTLGPTRVTGESVGLS